MSMSTKTARASSNWLALKDSLPQKVHKRKPGDDESPRSRKRQKASHHPGGHSHSPMLSPSTTQPAGAPQSEIEPDTDLKRGESRASLRRLASGELACNASQQLPGKYLALDCEMVGVGLTGAESSLARVSLVNYYGVVQLDEFVRQRERVVDYRTEFSGVRPTDMVNAKPFEEIQKRVAELLKDRILIGHAVYNDLKALLLTHPRPSTRDTQFYAHKHKLTRSNRIALRTLVMQELGVKIQGGEHSSVTDARATMAVYRLHRKEWEEGLRNHAHSSTASTSSRALGGKKRKAKTSGEDAVAVGDSPVGGAGKQAFPGGGRKGVSSGSSVVVHRKGSSNRSAQQSKGGKVKKEWWKEIG